MTDTDEELDLFSFAALQRAPDHLRPRDIPAAKPAPQPLPVVSHEAVPAPNPYVYDPTEASPLPRSPRPPRRPRLYKSVGDVPEISEEALARSPKLRRWRELERNRLNAQAYRKRENAAKKRAASRKMRVCRACFRVFGVTDKLLRSPYCNKKCRLAWDRVNHCFDGDAAWLYRIREARAIMLHPDGHSNEVRLASEHLLTFAAPDYSPHVPKPGTLMNALAKALTRLREKWAPYAAEAIRTGAADSLVKPDMMATLGSMIRGEQ